MRNWPNNIALNFKNNAISICNIRLNNIKIVLGIKHAFPSY